MRRLWARAPRWPRAVMRIAIPGLVVLGCNGCEKKGAPGPVAPARPTPSERAQADAVKPELPVPPGEEVSFDAALARVEAVRGLKKKSEVRGLIVAEDDLADHLERALAFERPEQVLLGTEQMLIGLGLVERSFKLEKTMVALLHENLAGLYEPRLRLMMVRKDLPQATSQITLLHELVHALQDQYFDLDEIVTSHADDSDRSSALSCLAEGDATSAMLDGVLPAGKTALDLPDATVEAQFFSQAPQTDAPAIIVRSLFAPYLDGFKFVQALRRRGGFEAVNRAFHKPPLSTEHVLHVEKYDAYEQPRAVDVPRPPGPEFELLLHDIWGEQSLRLALEEWMPPDRAAEAAAGWGGDRIVAYRDGERWAVAWHLVMDDEKEGQELEAAWLASAPHAPSSGAANPCWSTSTGIPLAVARRAAEVWIVGGPFQRGSPPDQRGSGCSDAQRWLETLLSDLTQ